MKSTARRDGDEYVLNGSKTFITNGPYADTTVFICKLDEGNPPEERKVLSFVLDKGMPGFEQSKPLRKMGMHSSPTGELFLTTCGSAGTADRRDRGRAVGGREGAKDTFSMERSGVAAMSLGIIERCLELSHAVRQGPRCSSGSRSASSSSSRTSSPAWRSPASTCRTSCSATSRCGQAGKSLTPGRGVGHEAVLGPPATEVALEAVQLHGGNGYMAEFQVEQLARDAKVLQIYAGTDEIQITHIAKDLLRR